MRKFEEAGTRIGNLVEEKNKFYGNSFKDSAYFLKLLYPDGIPPDKYCDILLIVRIFDKLKRIATRKDAFGENPWEDIVGYSLLGTVNDSNQEEEPLFENEVARCPIHKCDMTTVFSGVTSAVYCTDCINKPIMNHYKISTQHANKENKLMPKVTAATIFGALSLAMTGYAEAQALKTLHGDAREAAIADDISGLLVAAQAGGFIPADSKFVSEVQKFIATFKAGLASSASSTS